LRRLVLGSGLLLSVIAIPVISTLGLTVMVRAVLAAAWLSVFARQWWFLRRAYAQNGILRVDAKGRVQCQCSAGEWAPLEILPGSIVTNDWAWLRLGQADGPDYAELLRGDARQSQDWRRFQVIWRHVGATP
jgi:hypothetical protein